MKKFVLVLAAIFTFSTAFVSCRDTETDDVEIEGVDDNEVNFDQNDNVDDDGDIENAIEEGANEAAENTGLGGTDDI